MTSDNDEILELANVLDRFLEKALDGGCPDYEDSSMCWELATTLIEKGWRRHAET